ncbi:MAG: small subunit ribosomal protein S3 [Chloroflexi bacterium]|nr:MAG: small subunit ribosomal protein S3 [Chloroflexota bacterium]
MGQKIHPNGFRVGITRDWHATWFAGQKDYASLVKEDISIRRAIDAMYQDAGISKVDIERDSNEVAVTIHTARPGIVIGRGGVRVDELRKDLETLTGSRRAKLNVVEVKQAELDAYLVARNVADQLERRIAFRRAIRQAVMRTMQAGAEGIKIAASGRLAGADIARSEKAMEGRVPLHTLRADIDYGLAEAQTEFGVIGVKVWICRGEILNPTIIGENSSSSEQTAASNEIDEIDVAPIQVVVTAQEDNPVSTGSSLDQTKSVNEDDKENEGASKDAST